VFQNMWREVGQNIGRYRTYPRLVGETGGKDFVMVHESADTDALRTALVRGAFEYQGQKCSAASRAYIPQTMWNSIKSELVDLVDAIPQGDVADFRNFMGAVIDGRAYANHMNAIEYARKQESAKVIAGGKGDDKVGWFIRPTVIETTDPDFKLLREGKSVASMRDKLMFGESNLGDTGHLGQNRAAAMANDAEVCGCNGVCKGKIVGAIRDGATTLDAVRLPDSGAVGAMIRPSLRNGTTGTESTAAQTGRSSSNPSSIR